MAHSPPHSGDLRKGRRSAPLGLYYITKNVVDHPPFSKSQYTDCCESLQAFRQKGTLYLHAFVIMPNHWHGLFSLNQGLALDRTLHALCRHTSFPSRQRGDCIPWQEGFYDHKVRVDDKVSEIVAYIENNPVEAGLVEAPAKWPWSSAHSAFRAKLDRGFLGHERWSSTTPP